MFSSLPTPDRALLSHAPVNLVIWQIDFEAAAVWAPNIALRWRDALAKKGFKGKLVGVRQQRVEIQVGAGTTLLARGESALVRQGHQIQGENGDTAALYPDSVVIESRSYAGWENLRRTLAKIIDVAKTLRNAELVKGITLRFVNALSDKKADSVAYWKPYVQSPFLGPLANDALTEDFSHALYLLTFQHGANCRAEMRIGIQPDAVHSGKTAYVFDTVCATDEVIEFAAAKILATSDELHTMASKLFQQVITKKYHEKAK
jgi:uncharacterized protein (TIGR04255 family)